MTPDEELERAELRDRGDQRVRAILDAAVENYRNPGLTVSQLAELAGVGERKAQVLARLAFNMTPLQVVYRLRVLAARELIESRQARSVREAALAVGVPDVGRFAARYKAVLGTTPTAAVLDARRQDAVAARAQIRANPVTNEAEHLERAGVRLHHDQDPRLRAALEYVVEHYRVPLAIAAVAEHAGASERWVQRAFEVEFGIAPLFLQQHLRMHAARDLIVSGQVVSVVEAARAVGFTHAGRFSVRYRRMFGEAPSETLGAAAV